MSRILIPRDHGLGLAEGIDWLGSVLVTVSLMVAVYAIVQVTTHGWGSPQVLGFGAVAAVLMLAFILVEARISNPIMPLGILRLRGLIGGSVVRAFLVVGMYATFFLGTLYLERVLRYSAIDAGLAFLPWTLTVATLSIGVTGRLVKRFGPMRVLLLGMAVVVGGLTVLTNANTGTSFFPTLFVGFFAIGFGIGCAFMPLMTMSMADVPASESGLASAITTLSQQVGGAFGIALLSTIATTHTRALVTRHVGVAESLVSGYHLAFTVGAGSVLAGIVIAAVVLRAPRATAEPAAVPAQVGRRPAPGPQAARITAAVPAPAGAAALAAAVPAPAGAAALAAAVPAPAGAAALAAAVMGPAGAEPVVAALPTPADPELILRRIIIPIRPMAPISEIHSEHAHVA